MNRVAKLSALTLSAVALAAAGCGGDDEASTTTGAQSFEDAASYRAAADKICRQSERELNKAAQSAFPDLGPNGEPSPDQAAEFATNVIVPDYQDQLDQLRALSPPSEDAGQVEEILNTFERGIAEVENDPESIVQGPPPAIEEAGNLARDYGFDDCGS